MQLEKFLPISCGQSSNPVSCTIFDCEESKADSNVANHLRDEFDSLSDMINCIIESCLVRVSPSQSVDLIITSKSIFSRLQLEKNVINIAGLMCGSEQVGSEWIDFLESYAQSLVSSNNPTLIPLTACLLELEKHSQLETFLENHFGVCLDVCETTMLAAAKQQEPIVQLFLQFHTVQPPPPLLAVAINSLEKLADEFYSGLLLEKGQHSASGLINLLIPHRHNEEICRKITANNLFQLLTNNATASTKNSQLFLSSPITIGHDERFRVYFQKNFSYLFH